MTRSRNQGPINETPSLQWFEDAVERMVSIGCQLFVGFWVALWAIVRPNKKRNS
jgi:hypothetical protein